MRIAQPEPLPATVETCFGLTFRGDRGARRGCKIAPGRPTSLPAGARFPELMHRILIPAEHDARMLQAAINDATAPCPRCQAEMVLAVAIPHPVAPLLARHTYLCARCNQTRSYVLPVDAPGDGEDAAGHPDVDTNLAP